MKVGKRECFAESQKLNKCLSNYKNPSLCLPEEEKVKQCLNRRSVDVILSANNIK